MRLRISKRRGFTLIEIMIVVAIVGLLAALAIPNYAKSRSNAYKTGCINNLRQIEGAIELWALDQKKDADQRVTYTDISSYLKHSVACPSGGATFEDSYAITTINAKPTCLRKPDSHKLPD
jgi:prepilin-type N-terminal cleavage/methylation domain-containing protein